MDDDDDDDDDGHTGRGGVELKHRAAGELTCAGRVHRPRAQPRALSGHVHGPHRRESRRCFHERTRARSRVRMSSVAPSHAVWLAAECRRKDRWMTSDAPRRCDAMVRPHRAGPLTRAAHPRLGRGDGGAAASASASASASAAAAARLPAAPSRHSCRNASDERRMVVTELVKIWRRLYCRGCLPDIRSVITCVTHSNSHPSKRTLSFALSTVHGAWVAPLSGSPSLNRISDACVCAIRASPWMLIFIAPAWHQGSGHAHL